MNYAVLLSNTDVTNSQAYGVLVTEFEQLTQPRQFQVAVGLFVKDEFVQLKIEFETLAE